MVNASLESPLICVMEPGHMSTIQYTRMAVLIHGEESVTALAMSIGAHAMPYWLQQASAAATQLMLDLEAVPVQSPAQELWETP